MVKHAPHQLEFERPPAPGSVLVTEADPSLRAVFERHLPAACGHFLPGLLSSAQVTDPLCIEALLVTVRSPVGAEEMGRFPNLRFIATGSTGYDHIDIAEARRRGITVCNVPDYGPAVAEFNIALMLALSRHLHRAHLQTLQREFSLSDLLGRNLHGRNLGIVGTGRIGTRVAELAAAFGMKVRATDPNPRPEEAARLGFSYTALDQLLQDSEVIALCCPLTPSTTHLLGKREFALMRRGVLIVNTSRGAVIDASALLWGLQQGIVAGAALDVMEGEVLLTEDQLVSTLAGDPSEDEAENIAEDLTLMRHPNVLVTPHMAYYTEDSLESIRIQTVLALKAFLEGRPIRGVE